MAETEQDIEVTINGVPDLKMMSEEEADTAFSAFEVLICMWVERKNSEETQKGG